MSSDIFLFPWFQICSWVQENGGWSAVLSSGLNVMQQTIVIGTCVAVFACCMIYIRKNCWWWWNVMKASAAIFFLYSVLNSRIFSKLIYTHFLTSSFFLYYDYYCTNSERIYCFLFCIVIRSQPLLYIFSIFLLLFSPIFYTLCRVGCVFPRPPFLFAVP